ncbi:hypothetical protein Tco_0136079, partial [Tanacetum coccineum]
DHPLKNMEDRGIFDSGCSGQMTGNKDHLDDFEECKGGSITFGEISHHFIRDSYEKKLIRVEKIHTDFNVADLLTKAFDGPRFNFLVVNIGYLTFSRLYLDCIGAWTKVELKLCKYYVW